MAMAPEIWFFDTDLNNSPRPGGLSNDYRKAWRLGIVTGDTVVFPMEDNFTADIEDFGTCRQVGPFTVRQILACVEVAEFVRNIEAGFLPQCKPGERPITAGRANGLQRAAALIDSVKPSWHKHNFE
jgi:hypothetical protein